MTAFKHINDLVTFLLELAMYVALGYAGAHIGSSKPLQYLFAIGLPLSVMIFWGNFMAPKAKRRLSWAWLFTFYVLLFEGAAALLYLTGPTKTALIFAIVAILNILIKFLIFEKRQQL